MGASQPASLFAWRGETRAFKFIKVDRTRMSYLADLPIFTDTQSTFAAEG